MSETSGSDREPPPEEVDRGRWWVLLFKVPWLSLVLLALLAAIIFGPLTHWEPWVPALFLRGHAGWVWAAAFSPGGDRVVTASDDGTAKLWDATTGTCVMTLTHRSGAVYAAEFSPDGQRTVTAGHDCTARIWDASDGKCLAVLRGHKKPVRDASYSRDGKRIVTASYDGTARVWDADDGRCLVVSGGHSAAVLCASFSPDGSRLVTGSNDVRVWDAETGKLLAQVGPHWGTVRSASFSPDGDRVLTVGHLYYALVWRVGRNKRPRIVTFMKGHTEWVHRAAFSLDGKYVVTGSDDATGRVWCPQTGKCLAVLTGHARAVYGASFSPDGRLIVTSGKDKTTRIWRRRRPEWWWGIFCLPEFWLAFALGGAFVWSAVRDVKRLRKPS